MALIRDWHKWLDKLDEGEKLELDQSLTALLTFDKVRQEFKGLDTLLSLVHISIDKR